jgi:hypothetical protein
MKIHKSLWKLITVFAFCIILIIGMVTLSQFTRANASTPTKTPTIPLPITLTPTSAAYPPPGGGMSSLVNTAYPAPQVDLSGGAQTNNPAPSSTPIPTEIPTATPLVMANGWYLYNDPDAGYSLEYPIDAFLHTSREGNSLYKTVNIQFNIPGAGYQGMVINVLPKNPNQQIEDIFQGIYTTNTSNQSVDTIKATIKSLKISGKDVFRSDFQPALPEFTIIIPYKNKVLLLVPVTEMGLTKFDLKALDLFNQIIGTINTD